MQAIHALSRWSHRAVVALAVLGAGLVTSPARASELINGVNFPKGKQRIDGLLREWPELQALNVTVSGSKHGTSAKGLVGYDDKNLYVGMDITDAKFVRTKAFGAGEDMASLLLAFPRTSGGYNTYTVLLYPGDPGKTSGVVKLAGGGKIRGSLLVELAMDGGFSFEASIPWSAFPDSKTIRVGLRAALRYQDADRAGHSSAVIATSKAAAGSTLPPLLIEGEYSLYQGLIYEKQLSETPDRLLVGDVAGSALAEKVALYGRYLTIVGPGFRKGTEFYFQDTAVARAADLVRLELVDLTGDGKKEFVLQKRIGPEKLYREVLQVWSISAGSDEPFKAFEHEVGIGIPGGHLTNEVAIGHGKITVSQGKYEGIDSETWTEPVAGGGMEPALLPWHNAESRTYEFKDGKFEMTDEKVGKPRMKPAKGKRFAHASAPSPGGGGSSGSDESSGGSGAPLPPRARPPTSEELQDQVYALYRRERGATKSKPRFDFVTDVAEGSEPERVLIHGKDIVAFGKGFRAGESYVYIGMGFEESKDVLAVTARDLTGDGKAEIIVRGVLRAKASKALGGEVITRHALFIYSITSGGIARIFAAETGRSLGDNAILGNVAFHPSGDGMQIELTPGRAVGWTKETYPFPPDQHPYGGLEPLLLPWTEMSARKYAYSGGHFSQQ